MNFYCKIHNLKAMNSSDVIFVKKSPCLGIFFSKQGKLQLAFVTMRVAAEGSSVAEVLCAGGDVCCNGPHSHMEMSVSKCRYSIFQIKYTLICSIK